MGLRLDGGADEWFKRMSTNLEVQGLRPQSEPSLQTVLPSQLSVPILPRSVNGYSRDILRARALPPKIHSWVDAKTIA